VNINNSSDGGLMTIALPEVITNLFHSTALTVEDMTLGKDIWIVYAHGKYSKLKNLKTKSLQAFEQFTPNGTPFFSLYLVSIDEKGEKYHICIEDINLNHKSKYRYTNHFAFNEKTEAEYYQNLCVEFDIQSEFETQPINKV